MILQFKLDDWVVFKNIFINIYEIIDEMMIECTYEGLRFKGIDRGHVCFFEGEISKDLFDEYNLEDCLLLYLDLFELIKIFKRGKGKDTLVFEADTEIIQIIFEDKTKRSFQLTQLIDLNDEMRDLPSLDYNVVFECDYESINNSLKDADLYSDRLTFICEDNVLELSCEGAKGKYKNECPISVDVDGSYQSTYTVGWLSKIFNTKLTSNNFKIHMGTDYPMLIEIDLENVKMKYLLAPRLQNE